MTGSNYLPASPLSNTSVSRTSKHLPVSLLAQNTWSRRWRTFLKLLFIWCWWMIFILGLMSIWTALFNLWEPLEYVRFFAWLCWFLFWPPYCAWNLFCQKAGKIERCRWKMKRHLCGFVWNTVWDTRLWHNHLPLPDIYLPMHWALCLLDMCNLICTLRTAIIFHL